MTKQKLALCLSFTVLFFVGITACVPSAPPPTPVESLEQRALSAAEEAAAATLEPHEINNIAKRRLLMGRTGLVLYVVFINDMGQPVDYFTTNGKCTSSTKRLTSPERLVQGYYEDFVMKAPSEDGTQGSSDEYQYCFTTDGRYKQWNGDYYASDAPIELTIKPLVVDIVEEGESGIQSQQ